VTSHDSIPLKHMCVVTKPMNKNNYFILLSSILSNSYSLLIGVKYCLLDPPYLCLLGS
jgi:hypothetical protein